MDSCNDDQQSFVCHRLGSQAAEGPVYFDGFNKVIVAKELRNQLRDIDVGRLFSSPSLLRTSLMFSRRERLSRLFTLALRSTLAAEKSLHVDSSIGNRECIFNIIRSVLSFSMPIHAPRSEACQSTQIESSSPSIDFFKKSWRT